jgi:Na+-translocating ferredoxin:NAD+ oxidoreductase RNF subunit RnfB
MYTAIILLGSTGVIAAFILYFLAKQFEVKEDIRIGRVLEILPGVNCGGCGFPGCGGFATACVNADSLDGLSCPVAEPGLMKKVGAIIGLDADETIQMTAVLRCNGTCEARSRTNIYDGAKSCAVISSLYSSDTGCSYGCLGLGDCVAACLFDAIHINPVTGLAEVSEDKCVACRVCEKACPKNLIEMRKKGLKSHRIYIACINKDKGGIARKACQNACIGCNKCLKECDYNAITIAQNIAYIDDAKCRLCSKCVPVCPTGAIHELNRLPPCETAANDSVSTKPATKFKTTLTTDIAL